MGRGYGMEKTALPMRDEPCRETLQNVKQRCDKARKTLDCALWLSHNGEMDYTMMNQMIGSAYLDYLRQKHEYKRRKSEAKQAIKKGKKNGK